MNPETDLKPSRPAPVPPWLISFADLLGILLCFFVMLYAISAPRDDAFRAAIASLAARLNPDRAELPRAPKENIRLASPRAVNLDYLSAIVAERVAEDAVLRTATQRRLEDRIVLTLRPEHLLEGAPESLSSGGREAVSSLAQSLRFVANRLEIVARYDGIAATRAGRSDGWEHALNRAAPIAAAFHSAGYSLHVPIRSAFPTTASPAGSIDIVIREGVGS